MRMLRLKVGEWTKGVYGGGVEREWREPRGKWKTCPKAKSCTALIKLLLQLEKDSLLIQASDNERCQLHAFYYRWLVVCCWKLGMLERWTNITKFPRGFGTSLLGSPCHSPRKPRIFTSPLGPAISRPCPSTEARGCQPCISNSSCVPSHNTLPVGDLVSLPPTNILGAILEEFCHDSLWVLMSVTPEEKFPSVGKKRRQITLKFNKQYCALYFSGFSRETELIGYK